MGFGDQIAVVAFLCWFNEEIVEYFFGIPLEKKFPNMDRWWLRYVALGLGFMWSWLSLANIIAWANTPEALGRVITGILVGSGSQILHKGLEKLRGK